MASFLVTGASRGIGLEMVKQLSGLPSAKVSKIFALTRSPAPEALSTIIDQSSGRVVHVIADVTQASSVDKAAAEVESALQGQGLGVLINNAGQSAYTPGGVPNIGSEQMIHIFNTNVVGVQLVTSKFLPLLRKGGEKKIINISSTLGSIGYAKHFNFAPVPSYKISKAALNMLHSQYAIELAEEGFTVLAISPGWLTTDLGGETADLDVTAGVTATMDIVMKAKQDMNGKFVNIHVPGWENGKGVHNTKYDGAEIPW